VYSGLYLRSKLVALAIGGTLSCWPLVAKRRVTFRGIRGGWSDIRVGFLPLSPFHHCSIFIYQCHLRYANALTRQHIITASAFQFGAPALNLHSVNYRVWTLLIRFRQSLMFRLRPCLNYLNVRNSYCDCHYNVHGAKPFLRSCQLCSSLQYILINVLF
jgi:hypothetical protein